jgi:hypothetical protein
MDSEIAEWDHQGGNIMTEWKSLTDDEQTAALQQVAGIKHLPPQAVEKDLWVTIILQMVFSLPFADKLVFKGGTSLSKVFGKIERFSEDIDLAVDRSLFGMEGDLTKRQLKQLRKLSSVFVRDTFLVDLQKVFFEYGFTELSAVAESDGEGDATYPEPRRIIISYPSLFHDRLDYIKPSVMLETGARSLLEPIVTTQVQSLVEQSIPELQTSVVSPSIATAVIEKTFLEKAFLLHELFTTPTGSLANRKSRHMYDLVRMMDEPFADKAIRDDSLWENIRHHRQVFTSMAGVDYSPDIRQRIVLVPPGVFLREWRADYEAMRGTMIFGSSPSFDELLVRLHQLQDRFRRI